MMDSQYSTQVFVFGAAAAVVLIVVAGAVVTLLRSAELRSRDDQDTAASTRVVPVPEGPRKPFVVEKRTVPPAVPVVFAALVRAEQARKDAGTPEKAAALFADAEMRWTGKNAEWEKRVAEMRLLRLHSCLPGEDKDMIVTFSARLPCDEIPSSRLDIRRCLNRLASNGGLTCGDLYVRPVGIDPSRFGFKEF